MSEALSFFTAGAKTGQPFDKLRANGLGGTTMKTALLIVGVFALLMGILWIGQGTGVVHWPASSFMIDQRPWATRGALLAVVGVALIIFARRR